MFHLKYPRFRGFFSWDELGCLSRALGFPVDIFKNNLSDEIQAEDNGLPLPEAIKVLDHKLLYKCLHLTQNLHTADWNTCVFRKCLFLLEHRAITYSEINEARVAYQTYEAGDMKGMVIDQQTLMRTLRMCDKMISPMKLMHRIKHSHDMYEEPGRIQLYEFIELLYWADGYKSYVTDETYGHFEMEGELFKLTDFDKLLSHHDERESNRLNAQYLKEEWEFPEVKVKDSRRFKDTTVICGDSRVEMTTHQKQCYRHLRGEVTNSQKSVHYVKGGFVRERPVTAPNLKVYSQKDVEEFKKRQSLHVQNVIYNKLQRLLQHAYNKDKKVGIEPVDMSDRPVLAHYTRGETPKVVTEEDMKETIEGWERLLFDVETEEGRYEINRDDEMEKIIPQYKQRRDELNEAKRIAERNAKPRMKIQTPTGKKVRDPYTAAISLAYPVPRLPPSHGRSCDARFRGWYGVRSKKGPHYILMSPYFTNSPKGQLFRKLAKMSDAQIKNIHGDFLCLKTKSADIDQRPVTAPAVMTMGEYKSKMVDLEKSFKGTTPILSRKSSGYSSIEENDDKIKPDSTSKLHFEFKSLENKENVEVDIKIQPGSPEEAESGVESMYGSKESVESSLCEKLDQLVVEDTNRDNKPRAKSAYTHRTEQLQSSQDPTYLNGVDGRQPRSKSAFGGERPMPVEEIAPMPYMDHSKAKIVSVGSMGKVSILESISEAKYWEDLMIQEQEARQREIAELAAVHDNNTEDNAETSAMFDNMGNDAEEDNYIEGNISSQKGRKKKSRKNKSDNESDILSLILKEEKQLRAKEKRCKNKSKFDFMSNKSTASSGSAKTSRASSSTSRGSKSPQNVKTFDPAKTETNELNDLNSINKDDSSCDNKKHVVLKAPGDISARKEKPVRKYERLVKRLGDDITPYMRKQMLQIQI